MIYAEVIGDPIEHSKSPIIHKHWFEVAGMEADYRRTRVGEGEVEAYLEKRRADADWRGCNVTMPIKFEALEQADVKSDLAIAASAANMLIPHEGGLAAGNSDVGAIVMVLKALHEAGRAMTHVALYGTGGAARAVLVAARTVGLHAITIHARDRQKAIKLAVEFGLSREPRTMADAPQADGVINATPLGMVGHRCLSCDVAGIDENGWVFDMVTAPVETELVKSARARGLEIKDGIDMLVEQAAVSFEAFFDAPPKRERDDELFARLRA
ncbi:shikimate dehydrogenase family protein [Sphingomicrobium sediminis]|uniref:Shikimate dehydrogenase n=1 Tax=Sphingomicrobium sediminis TaxID=2950949 RepID=A0A9X2J3I7_9SPHN|nr:shikimate dehydrogenase [Sphingomicrobium sediminis]MCM8558085.1 shikimate dehydrogenase [Sphingomicrobium sediminis]